jgi:hypothetical protein
MAVELGSALEGRAHAEGEVMSLRERVEALEAALSAKGMELRDALGRLAEVGDSVPFFRPLCLQRRLSCFFRSGD